MDNFDTIKSIWHSEKGLQLQSAEEVIVFIQAYKRKRTRLLYILLVILFACLGSMSFVFIFYKGLIWTTRFGEVLVFATIFWVIHHTYKDLQRKETEQTMDVKRYLSALTQELVQRNHDKKRIFNMLFSLSVAYGFFIYEFAIVNSTRLLISYSVLVSSVCFLWFIYRPYVDRSCRNSIKNTIEKITTLQNQLEL